jgi:hypothetical protein
MDIRSRLAPGVLTLVPVALLCIACQGNNGPSSPSTVERRTAPPTTQSVPATTSQAQGAVVTAQGSSNGAAGQMPAYYEGQLFTVNMKEMPEDASASLIANNQSINEIYTTKDLDEEQDFIPVIDAIQGEEFNPLWRQILIVFNPGVTPHQFTSEDQIDAAAAGPHPEIRLVETDEVYRCSVVGRK